MRKHCGFERRISVRVCRDLDKVYTCFGARKCEAVLWECVLYEVVEPLFLHIAHGRFTVLVRLEESDRGR